ncbi:MAG: NAD(P)/FAD-dependent oxidoreductase [bacterium]|nr:NAD(P)/FAD-dependent oxidoreductase [bacterium]
MKKFDIIVVGAGSAGLNVAVFMNMAGFKVLLIEKHDTNIGGDCLNFGCIPSKSLIHIAREVASARNTRHFGYSFEGTADIKKVTDHIKHVQNNIRQHENADYFRKQGLTIELGKADFISPKIIEVNSNQYTARKIVIATGSRPRMLNKDVLNELELDEAKLYTNETIFSISFLPKHLIIIGGGPIGIELGQAFLFLGSKVTILQKGDRILPKEDTEISSVLHSQLTTQGMDIQCNVELKDKKELLANADAVLVAVGRSLNIEHLNLEKAGIKKTEDGSKIIVDSYLRTTNKHVLLCGDIVGQHQFTHAAELHASLILNNFFVPWPFKKKLNTDHLSWVTYTTPEVATFGLSEQELKKRNRAFTVVTTNFSNDDRAITDGYTYGLSKLFVSNRGKIYGGSMVAPHAGELIQELILANTLNLKLKDLFKKTYPYPTATRINRETALKEFLKKLSPFTKKILAVAFNFNK